MAHEEESFDFHELRRRFIYEEERRNDLRERCIFAHVEERSFDFHELRRSFVSEGERERESPSKQNSSLIHDEERDSDPQQQEKCYDPFDSSFTFVDGEDDLDFLCNDYKSLRALMSCGHAVTPMSLTDWCHWLLDEGECRFVCGQTKCDVEWSYEEVCKMALLTPEEKTYFEKKMFANAAQDYLNVKVCPGCKSRVMRADLHDLSVCCTVCSGVKKRTYRFCWQCLKEWKGPAPRSDRCGNDGCINRPLETLRKCPDIVFKDVSGVTGCPSIRACPTCGLLVEHNKTQCKSMVCPRCKVKFCFVCLTFTEDCLRLYPYELCLTGVTPRQTSIPVWQKK